MLIIRKNLNGQLGNKSTSGGSSHEAMDIGEENEPCKFSPYEFYWQLRILHVGYALMLTLLVDA